MPALAGYFNCFPQDVGKFRFVSKTQSQNFGVLKYVPGVLITFDLV